MNSSPHALIGLIYEAALDPGRWQDFLQCYLESVRATGAVLIYHDVSGHQGAIATSAHVPLEANRQYNEHFCALDPWIYAAESKGLLQDGAVIIGEEVVPRLELARTEYYNDFATHFGLSRMMGGVICRDGQAISTISTLRPDSLEPFGENERGILRLLIPHLYRARQLHRRIVTLERANTALLDALDRMPVGVIVVHEQGTVAFANSAANAVLEQCDGLGSSAEGLVAASPAESRALRLLVRAAAATAAGRGTNSGGVMSLSRPSMRRPFSILVTPLRPESVPGLGEQGGMAAVFVTDPERTVQTDADVIRRLWGLTPVEAAIAMRLASGDGISDISDQLKIADGTVRWHVKHVLAKTNTKRQSSLVRVLMMSPATVRR